MSALFSFSSFLVVLLLTICTCTYVKGKGARAAAAPLGLHPPLLHSLLTPACSWDPHLLQPRACSTSAPGERKGLMAAAAVGGAAASGERAYWPFACFATCQTAS